MKERVRLTKNIKINKPTKWDKKWRLVLFEIGGSNKKKYSVIYQELDNLGLVMISEGIYIHPYECFEAVQSLAKSYNLESYLIYRIEADIKEVEKLIIRFKTKISK